MEPARSSGVGSGNSGTYEPEIAESLRFEEEIQSLIHPSFDASPSAGGSFTALLGLPANQAVELLHEPPASAAASSSPSPGEMWRLRLGEHAAAGSLHLPLSCSPTFPANAALVERAARFSVFATEDSPVSSSAGDGGGPPSPRLKAEPSDSDSPPTRPAAVEKPQRSAKRKESANSKAKAPAKKSKSAEETTAAAAEEKTGGDKLPYIHVRARRGQATDSHSLAERARREKINARMKLLQELVPGCSKITGTALVLDEIINHVQCLQRQVEFLSMRLAAVNPRIDFSGLDSFLSAECGPPTAGSGAALDPAAWSSEEGIRRVPQQQIWHVDLVRPHQLTTLWERDGAAAHPYVVVNPGTSPFGYDPVNSVPLNSNQLKTEL